MAEPVSVWQLFVSFARANLLGYGGGPGVIPLVEAEVVRHQGWMTSGEFAETLALGNTLPGPIATKMAAYIGYKLAGIPGATATLAATVLPTATAMVLLAAVLLRYSDSPVLKGMIRAVKPVVFVMLALLAYDFLPSANPLQAGWIPAAIAALAFVAIFFFHVHQAVAVAVALIIGGVMLR